MSFPLIEITACPTDVRQCTVVVVPLRHVADFRAAITPFLVQMSVTLNVALIGAMWFVGAGSFAVQRYERTISARN